MNAIASLVIGAVLFGVVQHWPIAPFAWISLALLLHASRAMPPLLGFAALYVAIYAAIAAGNRGVMPIPGAAYFFVLLFVTLATCVPFVVDRLPGSRLGPLHQSFVFALTWVSIEFLRSRLTPFSTWQAIGYTQSSHLVLMQVAAVTGIWGVLFLVTWGASVGELLWSRHADWLSVRVPVIAFSVTFAAVLIGGAMRLALAPTDRPTVRMATVNRPLNIFAPGEVTHLAEGAISDEDRGPMADKLARLHDWFLDESRREARAGARLIAWPEASLIVFAEDEQAFMARAQRLATHEHIYLAMGMNTVHPGEKPPSENKLVLIDPDGRVVTDYQKSHPLMGWEAGIIRAGQPVMQVADSKIGTLAGAICNDSSFPEFVRQAGEARADVLIEPVNDWRQVAAIHFQMDAVRAIENGVALLRPAANGLTGAVDPWGRTLAKADYFATGERAITVQMPIGRVATLYARIGDLFAWLCVIGLIITLATYEYGWPVRH